MILALTLGFWGPFASALSALDFDSLVKSVEPDRAVRYEPFRKFQIRGICGTARLDLASAYGANTIRTYTPPTRAELDEYQRLGFRVIVGIWMPHQGKNSGKGGDWTYDYRERGAEQLKNFREVVERIGDHPAILLWCLGNEVHLEEPYLETVNRMSAALHERYPRQLSSLTMVNAPKEKLALIKRVAPDLDVIGYNSYGQGAVGGAARNLEEVWGRAYYVSEFGPQGPWSGRKTAWGVYYEQSYDAKLGDLRRSFQHIDAAPRCLGSTMFLWGYWSKELPTYFSAFLSLQGSGKGQPEDNLFLTPIAEEFGHYWSGKYPPQRGPLLTKLNFAGVPETADAFVPAGGRIRLTAVARDESTPPARLRYYWWILAKGGAVVTGPVETDRPEVELDAPGEPDRQCFLMAVVADANRRASGFSVPFKTR